MKAIKGMLAIGLVVCLPSLGYGGRAIIGHGRNTCGEYINLRKAPVMSKEQIRSLKELANHDAKLAIELYNTAYLRQEPQHLAMNYVSWVQGFVGGSSILIPDMAELKDDPATQNWLDVYCAENPRSDISTAAADLALTLVEVGKNKGQ